MRNHLASVAALIRGAVVVMSLALASAVHGQTAAAVEYYYAAWDHYFVTADPAEIALLDGGAFDGNWVRTGESFIVWSQGAAGVVETCRFFSTSFAPRSSHFYTPFASECATVKSSKDWQYEGVAYFLQLADAGGTCPAGTDPLYRLYNNGAGGAPNHRYTTRRETVEAMRFAGWSSEGNGPDATFACVPGMGGAASPVKGAWSGTTSAGEAALAVVIEDGTYYVLYWQPGGAEVAGALQGTSSAVGGTFATSDAMQYPFAIGPLGASRRVGITGSYAAGSDLRLTIVDGHAARTAALTYVPGSEQRGSIAAIAATYTGTSGNSRVQDPTSFTIDPNAKLTGRTPQCSLLGSVIPRPTVDAYLFDVGGLGGPCIFITSPILGLMYYDAATRRIFALAPYDQRANMFFMIGTRP